MSVQMEIINGKKYPVCRDANGNVDYIIGDPQRDLAKKIAKAQAEVQQSASQQTITRRCSGGSYEPVVWSKLSRKDKFFYFFLSFGGMLTIWALLSVPMVLLLLLLI